MIGGGALLDSGCYCINFARMVLGHRPAAVQAAAIYGADHIDESLAATIEFDDALAQISCSFVAPTASYAQVLGTDGVLETALENALLAQQPARIRIKRGRARTAMFDDIDIMGSNGYRREAEALASLAAGNTVVDVGISDSESIDVAATLDAVRRSARRQQRVRIKRASDSR